MALRTVERLVVLEEYSDPMGDTRFDGRWEVVEMADLVKGDVFRLWEPDWTPDRVIDGRHDVCVSLTDAKPVVEGAGLPTSDGNHVVEALSLNGFLATPRKPTKEGENHD